MNENLLFFNKVSADQDSLLLQEFNIDTVNIDVHLLQERHPLVHSTSNVLSSHHQGRQRARQVVTQSKFIGVETLEVMLEAIEC